LGARGEGNVSRRRLAALADELLDLLPNRFEADAEALQGLGGDALTLVDEAEQDVLRTDVVVVEHPGLFLGQNHHSPRAVGKPLEHVSSLLYRAVRQGRCLPTQLFRISAPQG